MSQPARELFSAVAAASGLSPIFAPGTVRRALEDTGSSPQSAGPDAYQRALPALEARMRAFLEPPELRAALSRVRAVLERAGTGGQSHGSDPPDTR